MSQSTGRKRKSSGKEPKTPKTAEKIATPKWFRPKVPKTPPVDMDISDDSVEIIKSGRISTCNSSVSEGSLKENRQNPTVVLSHPESLMRNCTVNISPLKIGRSAAAKQSSTADSSADDSDVETLAVLKAKLKKTPVKTRPKSPGKSGLKQTSMLDFKMKSPGKTLKSPCGEKVSKVKGKEQSLSQLREEMMSKSTANQSTPNKSKVEKPDEIKVGWKRTPIKADSTATVKEVRLENMAEEEKRIAIKQGKLEAIKRQKAEARIQARIEAQKRFDESALQLTPLPTAQLIELPTELNFGDLIEATTFLLSFAPLLKLAKPPGVVELISLLTGGPNGDEKLAKILVSIIRLITEDKMAEDWKAFDSVPLGELQVTGAIAPEVLREILIKAELSEPLADTDFNEMTPGAKLSQLHRLINLALECEAIDQYQSDLSDQLTEANRQRHQQRKSVGNDEIVAAGEENTPVDLAHFYGPGVKSTVSSTISTQPGSAEDLASVVKRRRIEAAEERERHKIEAEKIRLEEEKVEAERNYQELCVRAKNSMRICHLGTDRNGWRYWHFGNPTGLFVETTANQDQGADWRQYHTAAQVDKLMAALHPRGENESELRREIKRKLVAIRAEMAANPQSLQDQIQSQMESSRQSDDHQAEPFAAKLKDRLLELNAELIWAALGGLPDTDALQISLDQAEKPKDLALVVEKIFKSVPPQMFTQFLNKPLLELIKLDEKQYKTDKPGLVQHLEAKRLSEINRLTDEYNSNVDVWLSAVKGSTTVARLHYLVEIFNFCVDWSKSVANAHCRVCRRSNNADSLVLCDICNGSYHLYCLKPKLSEVPTADWFCPQCRPQAKSDSNQNSSATPSPTVVEILHNPKCLECVGVEPGLEGEEVEVVEEVLVSCSTCAHVYHRGCHNPPLRNYPRGSWSCWRCRNDAEATGRNEKSPVEQIVTKRVGLRERKSVDYKDMDATEDSDGESVGSSAADRSRVAVESRCRSVFDRLVKSRLTASLMSMPKRTNFKTRSTSVSDLSGVKEKIGKYRSIDDFFYDLHEVILHGRQVYRGNERKLETLGELEGLVSSLEENDG